MDHLVQGMSILHSPKKLHGLRDKISVCQIYPQGQGRSLNLVMKVHYILIQCLESVLTKGDQTACLPTRGHKHHHVVILTVNVARDVLQQVTILKGKHQLQDSLS